MKRRAGKKSKESMLPSKGLYTLEVFIVGGPLTQEFIDQNPEISRTIEIRGDQTLEELHAAIFSAFDRFDDHLYEFQIGGKGPDDPDAKRYGVPFEDAMEQSGLKGDVTQTPIDSLNLKVGEMFGYWFDFGDDWWHQINVVSVAENAPPGEYPKVTRRIGESPPQYADMDE